MIFLPFCFEIKLFIEFIKTAFNAAVEKGHLDIVRLLLSCEKIDFNIPNVLTVFCYLSNYQYFFF